jgi:hypothetical protein
VQVESFVDQDIVVGFADIAITKLEATSAHEVIIFIWERQRIYPQAPSLLIDEFITLAGPVLKLTGHRGFKRKPLLLHRMLKGEPPRVQHEALREAGGFGGLAVDRVADNRGALVVHVHADLMGAASM